MKYTEKLPTEKQMGYLRDLWEKLGYDPVKIPSKREASIEIMRLQREWRDRLADMVGTDAEYHS